MMNKRIYILALFLLVAVGAHSQDMNAAAGEGKFNVVIAVLVAIFIGIIAYLVIIDRKISKIEKQRKQQPKI